MATVSQEFDLEEVSQQTVEDREQPLCCHNLTASTEKRSVLGNQEIMAFLSESFSVRASRLPKYVDVYLVHCQTCVLPCCAPESPVSELCLAMSCTSHKSMLRKECTMSAWSGTCMASREANEFDHKDGCPDSRRLKVQGAAIIWLQKEGLGCSHDWSWTHTLNEYSVHLITVSWCIQLM